MGLFEKISKIIFSETLKSTKEPVEVDSKKNSNPIFENNGKLLEERDNLIPKGILNEITDNDIDILLEKINKKREYNTLMENEKDKRYNSLSDKIVQNLINEKSNAEILESMGKIIEEDYLYFYPIYHKSELAEESGDITRASEILWFNIYHNGTSAPGNYNRLMILLRKMGQHNMELKVANIYRKFVVTTNDLETLDKRIAGIEKRIAKTQNTKVTL